MWWWSGKPDIYEQWKWSNVKEVKFYKKDKLLSSSGMLLHRMNIRDDDLMITDLRYPWISFKLKVF